MTVMARASTGTTIQGGINGDRSISDNCYLGDIASPQTRQLNLNTGNQFCHNVTPFRPRRS
jgi:hypothetical protein